MRLPERHSSPPEAPSDQNTVFISYSRTDMAFADELVAGLEMFGSYDVTIDRSDIRTGEEWQARLGALIADADTVVFILSPASVAAGATVIEWEIREAERLSKRILPVLAEPVNDAAVPASLGKLQRVDFTAGSFLGALRKLRDALDTDIDWISWHTYYARRAREWAAADHAANRLLLGGDIEAAQKWLQEPPKGAPEPTELHRSFIQASVEAQVARLSTERKRAEQLQKLVIRTRMALAVTVVLALAAIGAGAYAYFQQGKVLEAQGEAFESARRLVRQQEIANAMHSRYLSERASRQVGAGDATTAMLLSLAAMPDQRLGAHGKALRQRPLIDEAQQSLYTAYSSNLERRILSGHGGAVHSVRLSPNGNLILSASADRTARLWNSETAVLVRTITGHGGAVHFADFSPDGDRIVTASADQSVRLWNAADGSEIRALSGHGAAVRSARFSADGGLVVSASDDATIRIWDAGTGEQKAVLAGHVGRVHHAVFNHDASRIASAGSDGTGRIWDTLTGTVLFKLDTQERKLRFLAFSADGKQLLSIDEQGQGRLWRADTGAAHESVLSDHRGAGLSVAFNEAGSKALTTSRDNTAKLWDLAKGELIATLGGHAEAVTHAVFGPNEQTVITASRDGTIRIWDTVLVSGEKRIRELPGAPSERPVDSGRPPTADPAAREEAAPPSELTADDQDFSYYPPGVLKGEGRGRVGDRYVYLPHDIVFPVEVPPGAHAYMNSQIFGAGGGGWGGRGVIGGTECDPGNYDRHRNRDNYCEVRGWKMPLCPTGSGHQGQDIRPPTCVASKWWAVAVSDGIITRVTSNTTVVLKADDGTDYMYLSLDPSTIGVRVGDRVRKGDRLGRVSNFLGGRRATTLHLHFQARRAIRHEGKVILTDVPVYTSLIAAYRRMKGLDDLIDANGNLGVDPEREIDPETDRPFAQSSDGEQRVREVVERADPGRLRETFPTPQDLVDRAKRLVPRCLGPKQREAFYLAPEPDRWCITGPGREAERDPAKWQPKWPYDSPAWRDWLVGRDRGEEPKMPQDNAG